MSSTEMKSYLSLIPISAKVRRRQNRMTILCIVLAVFLVWFCKFYCSKAVIVGLILNTRQETISDFAHCNVRRKNL